jgi:hypothetical protein
VVHHYAGVAWPLSGSFVRDDGAQSAAGNAFGGVVQSNKTGFLDFTSPSPCITFPTWEKITIPFTAVLSFVVPASPPDIYTLWKAGTEALMAHLYVASGALTLSFGANTETGGSVSPGSSVSVVASCDADGGFFLAKQI